MKLKCALMLSFVTVNAIASTPTFPEYVGILKEKALAEGISASVVDKAFAKVNYRPSSVKADKNQPEKKLTLAQYLPRAVPQWKIKKARELYKTYYPELKIIGEKYGVQPRFLVSLWGIETNFGGFTGNYNVIDALATLAYDGRREAFFQKELMAALKIIEQRHISVDKMKGSWAGAMGQSQFMPSSFLNFAVDGDNDGKKDIWHTKADVFASSANYLHSFGWDDTYTWGREVQLPKNFDVSLQGREKSKGKYLTQWAQLGLRTVDGQSLPKLKKDIQAWLIIPDGKASDAYLVYNNYNVLMKWNRSYYFALSVSYLADEIVASN